MPATLATLATPAPPASLAPSAVAADTTDETLVDLWLHGRSGHTQRAYRPTPIGSSTSSPARCATSGWATSRPSPIPS